MIKPGGTDVVFLLEARQGSDIPARDAQQTIGKDPLSVVEVADHLFNGPFLRSRLEECL